MPWVLLELQAQPGARTPASGRQPLLGSEDTGLCRFSRVWTAGGGVDKTPCLRWGRGREEDRGRGKKRGRHTREKGEGGGWKGKERGGWREGGRRDWGWKGAMTRRWGTGLGEG